jgi:hypothetical protein
MVGKACALTPLNGEFMGTQFLIAHAERLNPGL